MSDDDSDTPVNPYRIPKAQPFNAGHDTRSLLYVARCEFDLACTYALNNPPLAHECATVAMRAAVRALGGGEDQAAVMWAQRALKLMEELERL